MKHIRSLAVVVAAGCLLAGALDAQILMKRGSEQSSPLFIPSTALFSGTGEFASVVPEPWRARHATTERLLEKHERRRGLIAQSAGTDRCNGVYFAEADVESPVIRDTRVATVTNAKAIFSGTIASVTPGLFGGSPGSLLKLEGVRTLKTHESYANVRDILFVRHPSAMFRAGDVDYCSQTAPGAHIPAVGDKVLVFAFIEPADIDGRFVYTFADDLIIEPVQGDLQIPPLLAFFRADGKRLEAIAANIVRSN